MDLTDKVAIVTGGGQGIGKSCALELLTQGCSVCILEQNEVTGKAFVENVPDDDKKRVLFVHCDVSSLDSFRAAFEKVLETFGGIDIVVNNAAVMNEEYWSKCVDVTFIGVIHGVKLALEYMGTNAKGHGGRVINIASVSGLLPFNIFPVYSACKHGVVGLTKSYGDNYHFEKTGITVNGICPGSVCTEFFDRCAEMSLDFEKAVAHQKEYDQYKMDPSVIGKALIKLLNDNCNGALLRVEYNVMSYVPPSEEKPL